LEKNVLAEVNGQIEVPSKYVLEHLARRCVENYITEKTNKKGESPSFDISTRAFYYYWLLEYTDGIYEGFKEEMVRFNTEFDQKFELSMLQVFKNLIGEKSTDKEFTSEFRGEFRAISRLTMETNLSTLVMEGNRLLEYSKLRLKKLDVVLKYRQDNKYLVYKELKIESSAKLQKGSSCPNSQEFDF
jgi:hypothetical protein